MQPPPFDPPEQPNQPFYPSPYPQPGQYPTPGFVPPTPPRRSKRRTGCIIAAFVGGLIIFLLTLCIVIGTLFPPPKDSPGANLFANPASGTTPTPETPATQSTQPAQASGTTPTVSPPAATPTLAPAPTPTPIPTEVTHQIGAFNGVDIGAGNEQWKVGVQTVKLSNGPLIGGSQTNFKEYTAKPGNRFLIVSIFMQNKGANPQPFNDGMWKLESLDKKAYTSLEGMGVDKGSQERGVFPAKTLYTDIEYEVPASASTFRLLFFLKPESKPIIFQFEAK